MKSFKSLNKISCLLALLLCVSFFAFACSGTKEVTTKTETKVVASKSTIENIQKEIKAIKPNEGGLKQELSTRATVSTTNKNEVTFEIPVNQLQGLKVGDAMVINSGKQSYPAKILTMPSAPQLKQGQPVTGSKVIVTASVGPGVNLPINNNGYTVTYLYNNRDPRSHYIKKEYIYYDGPRAYVNVSGPDRIIRRKYIRTGLINRYYAEILDELDETDRIIENYINDYVNNIVMPNILDDYTSQVIDAYNEYLESLNDRWEVDDDVNTITIDVNDIDWDKLEDTDIILTDDDIIEITEEIITETHEMEDDVQNNETISEESLVQVDMNDNDKDDEEVVGSGSFEDKTNDKNDDQDDDEVVATGDFSADREETTEEISERPETEAASEIEDSSDNDINDNVADTSDDADTNDDSNNDTNDDRSNDDSNNDTNDDETSETIANDDSNDNGDE